VTNSNFDGKFTSTLPVGEVRSVNLLTLSTHEAKSKSLELIAPIVLYLLLITNAEPNDPILVCFKPDVVVFE
jgi:cell shape-determining protein MreC